MTIENVEAILKKAEELKEEYEKYQKRPTKAASRRMRVINSDIKKLISLARRELLDADAAMASEGF